MRISTRGRYALRAMVDLAQHAEEGPVLRHDIAMRQGISADYVAQLFRHLRLVGLVKAVRGPGGGYLLAREPDAIRAGDIVLAVEGTIAVVECCVPGLEPACPRQDICATHTLWKQLTETVSEFLDSVTLQDLCDQAPPREGKEERDDG